LRVLGEIQRVQMWILKNQKRGFLGEGWCLSGRDSRGWKTRKYRVICEQLGVNLRKAKVNILR